nr:AMP-binding protein [Actinosynnema pretiosum]
MLTAFFAVLSAGLVPVPVVLAPMLDPRRYGAGRASRASDLDLVRLPDAPHPHLAPGEVVVTTSGTSGIASGCVHGLNALLRNARRHAEAIGQRGPPFTPAQYREVVARQGVTVSSLTHSLVRELDRAGPPPELRVLTVGGDTCPPELTRALLTSTPGLELYLTYGLSEAVRAAGRVLTCRELWDEAEAVAGRLVGLGGSGGRVGLHLERSADLVVAILAVLRAGAVVVPLDVSHPADRLVHMRDNAGVRLVIGHREPVDRFTGLSVVDELGDGMFARVADAAEPTGAQGMDLAYVVCTSGSTGLPKGVQHEHHNLENLIAWQIGASRCGEDERLDPQLLWDLVKRERVNRLFLPFLVLQSLALFPEDASLRAHPLRGVLTTAEQMQISERIRALFTRLPDCRLVNQWGTTETHVSTWHELPEDVASWPVLPDGEVGELWISEACVGPGCLNLLERTAQGYVPDPLDPTAPAYRSGDLGRVAGDGLECPGRRDTQVKLRGFRIELGEIETLLNSTPEVSAAVVVLAGGAAEDRRLRAHVAPSAATGGGRGFSLVPQQEPALLPPGPTARPRLPVPNRRPHDGVRRLTRGVVPGQQPFHGQRRRAVRDGPHPRHRAVRVGQVLDRGAQRRSGAVGGGHELRVPGLVEPGGEHDGEPRGRLQGERDVGGGELLGQPPLPRARLRGEEHVGERVEPLRGGGGQHGLPVGEVPVGRRDRHPGPPRGLGEAEPVRAALPHQVERRVDHRAPQVAVVVPALASGLPGHRTLPAVVDDRDPTRLT